MVLVGKATLGHELYVGFRLDLVCWGEGIHGDVMEFNRLDPGGNCEKSGWVM